MVSNMIVVAATLLVLAMSCGGGMALVATGENLHERLVGFVIAALSAAGAVAFIAHVSP
jgi:hypothetical protein